MDNKDKKSHTSRSLREKQDSKNKKQSKDSRSLENQVTTEDQNLRSKRKRISHNSKEEDNNISLSRSSSKQTLKGKDNHSSHTGNISPNIKNALGKDLNSYEALCYLESTKYNELLSGAIATTNNISNSNVSNAISNTSFINTARAKNNKTVSSSLSNSVISHSSSKRKNTSSKAKINNSMEIDSIYEPENKKSSKAKGKKPTSLNSSKTNTKNNYHSNCNNINNNAINNKSTPSLMINQSKYSHSNIRSTTQSAHKTNPNTTNNQVLQNIQQLPISPQINSKDFNVERELHQIQQCENIEKEILNCFDNEYEIVPFSYNPFGTSMSYDNYIKHVFKYNEIIMNNYFSHIKLSDFLITYFQLQEDSYIGRIVLFRPFESSNDNYFWGVLIDDFEDLNDSKSNFNNNSKNKSKLKVKYLTSLSELKYLKLNKNFNVHSHINFSSIYKTSSNSSSDIIDLNKTYQLNKNLVSVYLVEQVFSYNSSFKESSLDYSEEFVSYSTYNSKCRGSVYSNIQLCLVLTEYFKKEIIVKDILCSNNINSNINSKHTSTNVFDLKFQKDLKPNYFCVLVNSLSSFFLIKEGDIASYPSVKMSVVDKKTILGVMTISKTNNTYNDKNQKSITSVILNNLNKNKTLNDLLLSFFSNINFTIRSFFESLIYDEMLSDVNMYFNHNHCELIYTNEELEILNNKINYLTRHEALVKIEKQPRSQLFLILKFDYRSRSIFMKQFKTGINQWIDYKNIQSIKINRFKGRVTQYSLNALSQYSEYYLFLEFEKINRIQDSVSKAYNEIYLNDVRSFSHNTTSNINNINAKSYKNNSNSVNKLNTSSSSIPVSIIKKDLLVKNNNCKKCSLSIKNKDGSYEECLSCQSCYVVYHLKCLIDEENNKETKILFPFKDFESYTDQARKYNEKIVFYCKKCLPCSNCYLVDSPFNKYNPPIDFNINLEEVNTSEIAFKIENQEEQECNFLTSPTDRLICRICKKLYHFSCLNPFFRETINYDFMISYFKCENCVECRSCKINMENYYKNCIRYNHFRHQSNNNKNNEGAADNTNYSFNANNIKVDYTLTNYITYFFHMEEFTWTSEFELCSNCDKKRRDKAFCYVCNKSWNNIEDDLNSKCSNCASIIHNQCDRILSLELKEMIKYGKKSYTCARCRCKDKALLLKKMFHAILNMFKKECKKLYFEENVKEKKEDEDVDDEYNEYYSLYYNEYSTLDKFVYNGNTTNNNNTNNANKNTSSNIKKYNEVVKEPMCFEIIENRISDVHYYLENWKNFIYDLKLIPYNAVNYLNKDELLFRLSNILMRKINTYFGITDDLTKYIKNNNNDKNDKDVSNNNPSPLEIGDYRINNRNQDKSNRNNNNSITLMHLSFEYFLFDKSYNLFNNKKCNNEFIMLLKQLENLSNNVKHEQVFDPYIHKNKYLISFVTDSSIKTALKEQSILKLDSLIYYAVIDELLMMKFVRNRIKYTENTIDLNINNRFNSRINDIKLINAQRIFSLFNKYSININLYPNIIKKMSEAISQITVKTNDNNMEYINDKQNIEREEDNSEIEDEGSIVIEVKDSKIEDSKNNTNDNNDINDANVDINLDINNKEANINKLYPMDSQVKKYKNKKKTISQDMANDLDFYYSNFYIPDKLIKPGSRNTNPYNTSQINNNKNSNDKDYNYMSIKETAVDIQENQDTLLQLKIQDMKETMFEILKKNPDFYFFGPEKIQKLLNNKSTNSDKLNELNLKENGNNDNNNINILSLVDDSILNNEIQVLKYFELIESSVSSYKQLISNIKKTEKRNIYITEKNKTHKDLDIIKDEKFKILNNMSNVSNVGKDQQIKHFSFQDSYIRNRNELSNRLIINISDKNRKEKEINGRGIHYNNTNGNTNGNINANTNNKKNFKRKRNNNIEDYDFLDSNNNIEDNEITLCEGDNKDEIFEINRVTKNNKRFLSKKRNNKHDNYGNNGDYLYNDDNINKAIKEKLVFTNSRKNNLLDRKKITNNSVPLSSSILDLHNYLRNNIFSMQSNKFGNLANAENYYKTKLINDVYLFPNIDFFNIHNAVESIDYSIVDLNNNNSNSYANTNTNAFNKHSVYKLLQDTDSKYNELKKSYDNSNDNFSCNNIRKLLSKETHNKINPPVIAYFTDRELIFENNCYLCGSFDDIANMKICSYCLEYYHDYCSDSNLQSRSKINDSYNKLYIDKCKNSHCNNNINNNVLNQNISALKSSKQNLIQNRISKCFNCKNCVICGKNSTHNLISCSCCKELVHITCLPEKLNFNLHSTEAELTMSFPHNKKLSSSFDNISSSFLNPYIDVSGFRCPLCFSCKSCKGESYISSSKRLNLNNSKCYLSFTKNFMYCIDCGMSNYYNSICDICEKSNYLLNNCFVDFTKDSGFMLHNFKDKTNSLDKNILGKIYILLLNKTDYNEFCLTYLLGKYSVKNDNISNEHIISKGGIFSSSTKEKNDFINELHNVSDFFINNNTRDSLNSNLIYDESNFDIILKCNSCDRLFHSDCVNMDLYNLEVYFDMFSDFHCLVCYSKKKQIQISSVEMQQSNTTNTNNTNNVNFNSLETITFIELYKRLINAMCFSKLVSETLKHILNKSKIKLHLKLKHLFLKENYNLFTEDKDFVLFTELVKLENIKLKNNNDKFDLENEEESIELKSFNDKATIDYDNNNVKNNNKKKASMDKNEEEYQSLNNIYDNYNNDKLVENRYYTRKPYSNNQQDITFKNGKFGDFYFKKIAEEVKNDLRRETGNNDRVISTDLIRNLEEIENFENIKHFINSSEDTILANGDCENNAGYPCNSVNTADAEKILFQSNNNILNYNFLSNEEKEKENQRLQELIDNSHKGFLDKLRLDYIRQIDSELDEEKVVYDEIESDSAEESAKLNCNENKEPIEQNEHFDETTSSYNNLNRHSIARYESMINENDEVNRILSMIKNMEADHIKNYDNNNITVQTNLNGSKVEDTEENNKDSNKNKMEIDDSNNINNVNDANNIVMKEQNNTYANISNNNINQQNTQENNQSPIIKQPASSMLFTKDKRRRLVIKRDLVKNKFDFENFLNQEISLSNSTAPSTSSIYYYSVDLEKYFNEDFKNNISITDDKLKEKLCLIKEIYNLTVKDKYYLKKRKQFMSKLIYKVVIKIKVMLFEWLASKYLLLADYIKGNKTVSYIKKQKKSDNNDKDNNDNDKDKDNLKSSDDVIKEISSNSENLDLILMFLNSTADNYTELVDNKGNNNNDNKVINNPDSADTLKNITSKRINPHNPNITKGVNFNISEEYKKMMNEIIENSKLNKAEVPKILDIVDPLYSNDREYSDSCGNNNNNTTKILLNTTAKSKLQCSFCLRFGARKYSGRLIPGENNLWVHVNCLLWSKGIVETDNNRFNNFYYVMQKLSKNTSCCLCKESKATVFCANKKCSKIYHFPCAYAARCVFTVNKHVYCNGCYNTNEDIADLNTKKRVVIIRNNETVLNSYSHIKLSSIEQYIPKHYIGCFSKIGTTVIAKFGDLSNFNCKNYSENLQLVSIKAFNCIIEKEPNNELATSSYNITKKTYCLLLDESIVSLFEVDNYYSPKMKEVFSLLSLNSNKSNDEDKLYKRLIEKFSVSKENFSDIKYSFISKELNITSSPENLILNGLFMLNTKDTDEFKEDAISKKLNITNTSNNVEVSEDCNVITIRKRVLYENTNYLNNHNNAYNTYNTHNAYNNNNLNNEYIIPEIHNGVNYLFNKDFIELIQKEVIKKLLSNELSYLEKNNDNKDYEAKFSSDNLNVFNNMIHDLNSNKNSRLTNNYLVHLNKFDKNYLLKVFNLELPYSLVLQAVQLINESKFSGNHNHLNEINNNTISKVFNKSNNIHMYSEDEVEYNDSNNNEAITFINNIETNAKNINQVLKTKNNNTPKLTNNTYLNNNFNNNSNGNNNNLDNTSYNPPTSKPYSKNNIKDYKDEKSNKNSLKTNKKYVKDTNKLEVFVNQMNQKNYHKSAFNHFKFYNYIEYNQQMKHRKKTLHEEQQEERDRNNYNNYNQDNYSRSTKNKTKMKNQSSLRPIEKALNTNLMVDDDIPLAIKYFNYKKERPKVNIGPSVIHRNGLFAMDNFLPGEIVIEYVGELITNLVADTREKEYTIRGFGDCYMFRHDKYHIIDASNYGNLARFINHSCDPNCLAEAKTIKNNKHIFLYANKAISIGEEITYDYKFECEDEKIKCKCGASNCQGNLN